MRRRIIVCLGLLLALCVVGDVIALLCLSSSISELSALAECHRIQVMRADLSSNAARIETDSLAYAAGQPRSIVRRHGSVVRFKESLSQCGTCHHAPAVETRLSEIHGSLDRYLVAVDRVFSARDDDTARVLEHQANLIADELGRQATEMADLAQDHVSVRGSDVAASVQTAWMTLCGTLVAALVVGGVVAFHLQRRLTRPVDDLLRGIKLMRDGNSGQRFEIDADQEFRLLGDALNEAYASMATAQQGVLQAEKMAAVGKLAAGIAHEVGNPLASISAVAQMMRRHSTDPEQIERIDLIMQHVGRVSHVVRELLTFSRPSRDDVLGPVDVSALLDNAISLLRYDKRAGQTRVDARYEPGLRMEHGNSDRLILVFTNIILNAFDAMSTQSNGDAQLTVAAGRNSGRIGIRFEDNGPGMSVEQIESAFEPFFTTKDPGTGTGLGLWICYQVIRKHEGTVRIDAEPGRGTTVIIELPAEVGSDHGGPDHHNP